MPPAGIICVSDRPAALTIAGSDSSGGAGIQADLRTFEAFGVRGLSAVTAVTAQTSTEVFTVAEVDPGMVAAQIAAAVQEAPLAAVKTGLLPAPGLVEEAARSISEAKIPNLVVDPVIFAGGGHRLASEEAVRATVELLFPLASLITPNLHEAALLTGDIVDSPESMKRAAERLKSMGPAGVVVTGGHLEDEPVDIYFDGSIFVELTGVRAPGTMHGTGCVFSAAVAAHLAMGVSAEAAVRRSKLYVEGILSTRVARGVVLRSQ